MADNVNGPWQNILGGTAFLLMIAAAIGLIALSFG
jgi:hypothetical protein